MQLKLAWKLGDDMSIISDLLLIYLVIINLYLFCIMGFDKHQARKKGNRISERHLLAVGISGGSIGGYLGMKVFKHKTLHRIFKVAFGLGLVIDILLVALIFYYQ